MSGLAGNLRNGNVTRLYKALLERSKDLKYTDKEFFVRMVKSEFRKYQHESNPMQCEYQIKVSAFLKTVFFFFNVFSGITNSFILS